MKNRQLGRVAGIGALALLAAGALVIVAGGGKDSFVTSAPPFANDGFAGESTDYDPVTSAIDQALGRSSSGAAVAPQPPAGLSPAYNTMGRDNSQSGGKAESSGTIAQDAPIAGVTNLSADGDRKIVQTATMRLQVKEVGGSFEEIGRIATTAGGFVASSNFSLQGEQQIASLTVRVPSERYRDVLREIRGLGVKVDNEGSSASDVSEEYSDLAARQRNLEAAETQLLDFLGQAKNVSEVLLVQDRLNTTRGEIERVKGRLALLDKLTDLSTITVHLRPVVGSASSSSGGETVGSVIADAWQSSLDFLGDIGAGVLTVIVFGWWVVVLGLPTLWVGARFLRNRPSAAPVD